MRTYKLHEVKVQEDKKPYSYEIIRLIAEVDQKEANLIYEKGMKHIHIGQNILWLCFTEEKKYDVPAKTYVYLQDYDWSNPDA